MTDTSEPVVVDSSEDAAEARSDFVYELMPQQWEFVLEDDAWEILYCGAFGAGKTRALCHRAVHLARYPGARVALTRKTGADLKASTMITLLEPDGELSPCLPPGSYRHLKGEQRIKIHGGGEIVYFGCDNPTKVASRPLTDICIDEGIELEKDEYDMLLGRRRGKYRRPDGKMNRRSIATATNPGAPTHFLYDRFYLNTRPYRLLIETNTSENYHLTQDYITILDELTGQARARFFLGQWVAYEGAIYSMFSPPHHVREEGDRKWSYYVAGVDIGITHPTAIRVHGVDADTRRSHVVAEFYATNTTTPKVLERCLDFHGRYRCTFVVDPSAADMILQMREADLSVQTPPERDVLAGIRCVQAALSGRTEDGIPLLTMEPTCVQGNKEYPAYRWKPKVSVEQPIKELDHALDADRYALVYTTRGYGEPVSLTHLGQRNKPQPIEAPPMQAPEPEGRPFDPMAAQYWQGRRRF